MSSPPIVSTLIDIRRPSSVLVAAAAMWAGEHRWYSASGRVKSHVGISTNSIGALMVAVQLDSVSISSFMIGLLDDLKWDASTGSGCVDVCSSDGNPAFSGTQCQPEPPL